MLDWYIGEWLGINNQHHYSNGITTYPWVSELYYQSNFGIWWVLQGERIFVHPSKIIWVIIIRIHIDTTVNYQSVKVLAWYIDLKDINNKNTVKYPPHTGIEKVKSPLQLPVWYPKIRYKTNHFQSSLELDYCGDCEEFCRVQMSTNARFSNNLVWNHIIMLNS